MKTESDAIGLGAKAAEDNVLRHADECTGAGRALLYSILGFALMLTGFCCDNAHCLGLVLGIDRNTDAPIRMAFRLRHPHNWPAWLYFGILQATVLFLVALLIGNRHRKAGTVDATTATHMPTAAWVWFIIVAPGLIAMGEVAMRLAMANAW